MRREREKSKKKIKEQNAVAVVFFSRTYFFIRFLLPCNMLLSEMFFYIYNCFHFWRNPTSVCAVSQYLAQLLAASVVSHVQIVQTSGSHLAQMVACPQAENGVELVKSRF